MEPSPTTTVVLRRSTVKRLRDRAIHPRQSVDEILTKLLDQSTRAEA